MVKHTSTYKIPLDPLFLRKKKSCDPLFHLALFHFRRSLDRRGSRWERCCECFKTVCNHLSKINRRSTRIKSKFLRVGWLGVVGKGLYYHRFVDVLRHGKWDEMDNFYRECVYGYIAFVIYTLKGCKNTYKAHLTLNYCVCMRLKDILNPQCNNNNLQAVI